jgi:hypothetical protein
MMARRVQDVSAGDFFCGYFQGAISLAASRLPPMISSSSAGARAASQARARAMRRWLMEEMQAVARISTRYAMQNAMEIIDGCRTALPRDVGPIRRASVMTVELERLERRFALAGDTRPRVNAKKIPSSKLVPNDFRPRSACRERRPVRGGRRPGHLRLFFRMLRASERISHAARAGAVPLG